jgi:hypothetical protein
MRRQGEANEMQQRLQVAKLLVEAGAHPHAKDARGRSPVAVAVAAGNKSLAQYLDQCLEVQGITMMLHARRLKKSCGPFNSLTRDVFMHVLPYLLSTDGINTVLNEVLREVD